jgi:SOS-response transcriptional repressor LexA
MALTDSGRFARKLFNAGNLSLHCLLDPLGLSRPHHDAPHDRGGDSQLPRDTAVKAVVKSWPTKSLPGRGNLQGQNLSLIPVRTIQEACITVNKKKQAIGGTLPLTELAIRLKKLRESQKVTQVELAGAIGVTQQAITEWERGRAKPQPMAMMAIGRFFGGDEGKWWMEQAGKTKEMIEATIQRYMDIAAGADAVRVPQISGAVAAGAPRWVNEEDVEAYLCLPAAWIRPSQNVFAVEVHGDSMSPLIEAGYVVLIDTSQRDAKKLINKMVVAREGDGITVKWLRRQKDIYMLVPNHTSVRHPVMILNSEEDTGIVGRVVKWIGEPPASKR